MKVQNKNIYKDENQKKYNLQDGKPTIDYITWVNTITPNKYDSEEFTH